MFSNWENKVATAGKPMRSNIRDFLKYLEGHNFFIDTFKNHLLKGKYRGRQITKSLYFSGTGVHGQ